MILMTKLTFSVGRSLQGGHWDTGQTKADLVTIPLKPWGITGQGGY